MCSVVTTNYIGKTFSIYLLIIRYSYIQESVHVQNVVNYINKTPFMILLYYIGNILCTWLLDTFFPI